MDPAIAGTFSPPAQRANSRRVANADGSLDLEIYRIAETELPFGLTVLVASNDRVVYEAGTQLTKNVVETREGGFRIYTLHLGGETMPPGHYVAHRLARRLTGSTTGAVDYMTFPFVVPDTPFTRPLYSSYRTSQDLLDTVLARLWKEGQLQGALDKAVSEQLIELAQWQVWN